MKTQRAFNQIYCVISVLFLLFIAQGAPCEAQSPIIIDHTSTDITCIPVSAINQAKADLHIAYGRTSHGYQLLEGMKYLDAFMTGKGATQGTYAVPEEFISTSDPNVLDLRNWPWSLILGWQQFGRDLGTRTDNNNFNFYRNFDAWMLTTRRYLGWNHGSGDGSQLDDYMTGTPNYNPADGSGCNVILWAWCGQVASNFEGGWDGWTENWDTQQHCFSSSVENPYFLTSLMPTTTLNLCMVSQPLRCKVVS